nr:immunoglobulin light chain junction region [Macaca mulatta]
CQVWDSSSEHGLF